MGRLYRKTKQKKGSREEEENGTTRTYLDDANNEDSVVAKVIVLADVSGSVFSRSMPSLFLAPAFFYVAPPRTAKSMATPRQPFMSRSLGRR